MESERIVYVDKRELLELLAKKIKEDNERRMAVVDSDFIDLINDATEINDVAPVVHAEWKDNHCTACGMMPMGDEMWDHCDFEPPKFEYFMDYCPSCGAKMDGGKE